MGSITTQKIMINKIKHTNHNGRQHMTKYWSDSLSPQWSRQAVITVSRHDLEDHKNLWSRHRSFLYGCDRSPGTCVSKLEIEIPNLNTN